MFPRHPYATPHGLQQGNLGLPGVARVPAKKDDHRHPPKPMSHARRETLHQMKAHGDQQAVKSRLAHFVYAKLLNHFGKMHKETIASCVEAFFEVKSSFTSEDIVGLERVIAESIRSSHKPARAAPSQQHQQHQQMFPSPTQRPDPQTQPQQPQQQQQAQPRREQQPGGDEWRALQAARAAEDARREQLERERARQNEIKRKEGLDEQMRAFRENQARQRQERQQEEHQARVDREAREREDDARRRAEVARRAQIKDQQVAEISALRARKEQERARDRQEELHNLAALEERQRQREDVDREAVDQRAGGPRVPRPVVRPMGEDGPWGGPGLPDAHPQSQPQPQSQSQPTRGQQLYHQRQQQPQFQAPYDYQQEQHQTQTRQQPPPPLSDKENQPAAPPAPAAVHFQHSVQPSGVIAGGLKSAMKQTRAALANVVNAAAAPPVQLPPKPLRAAAVDDRYMAAVARKNARQVAAEQARAKEEHEIRVALENKQRYLNARREEEQEAMGLPKHHRQPPQPQQPPPRGAHPPNKGRHGAGGQGQGLGPPLARPVAGAGAGAAGGGDKQGHKARPPMAAFKRPFRG